MFKDTKKLINVLFKVKESRDNQQFITLVAYLLEETLSLSDFKMLIEQLENEIE